MFFLSRFPPRYIICKKKNLCTEKSLEFGRFRIYMTVLSLLNLILKYNMDCPIKAHTQTHNILSHSMLSKPFVMSWICAYRIAFSTKQVLISVSLRLQFKLLSKRTSSFSVLSVSPGGDVTIFPALCGFTPHEALFLLLFC